jgi:two-component system cell cycle sensor histidine kinase/response regulator CckA
VSDLRNLLSHGIGAHVELLVETAPGLPAIDADRGQVEQVLLNLAINARDAMPGGGALTIRTSIAELAEGDARLHPGVSPGRYIELAVSDTGTGMSAEVAARIFEPFFTTKPRDQGTGLGLATVYGIVTQAGGTISVDSEEGIGTTFRLYFPAASAPAIRAAPPAAAPGSRGNGQAILIVDDEPQVLEVAARILRGNGYVTAEASTYEEALSLAASRDFQLLLTDSVMPRMSGRALADHVAELRPGLPVLYMSGYSQDTPGPQRSSRDAAAFVPKPFTRTALLEKVHAALNTPPAAPAPRP